MQYILEYLVPEYLLILLGLVVSATFIAWMTGRTLAAFALMRKRKVAASGLRALDDQAREAIQSYQRAVEATIAELHSPDKQLAYETISPEVYALLLEAHGRVNSLPLGKESV